MNDVEMGRGQGLHVWPFSVMPKPVKESDRYAAVDSSDATW